MLRARLGARCRFAEDRETEPFTHPLVRAIVLHFGIGYEHPLVGGNSRTARALFYWSMLSQGYWLAEYLSISKILRGAPLNHRRLALLSHALRHPGRRYTFDSHRRSHDVVYQTARNDLLDLTRRGLLIKRKRDRRYVFSAPALHFLRAARAGTAGAFRRGRSCSGWMG